MAFIEVEDLSILLGHGGAAQRVLHDVSFSVEAGEVYGLVGESGSGKSTILRCIAGLYGNWTGRIAIGGKPLGPSITADRCRIVQMVFQDPYGSLHPKHTVNSQLMEPIKVHRLDNGSERVTEALRQVGLSSDFRFRYPHQLSGGQRQRVAIARALIMEPSLLLLDEPTSALDVSVQAEVLNLLADLRANSGLTYVLVSHDLAVIAHMCNRLSVMQDGRIVETLPSIALDEPGHQVSEYTGRLIRASQAYDRQSALSPS